MTTRRGHPLTLRVANPAAMAILAILLAGAIACGGSSGPASGVGGSKSGATPIFNRASTANATVEATPPATTPPTSTRPTNTPVATGAASGSVTIAGARYAFTVRTCAAINGQYYLVGDGEASVALASPLVIQTLARGSFIVDQPAVAARGNTLTVSGAGRNLVLPGERVDVTLTATCSALAN